MKYMLLFDLDKTLLYTEKNNFKIYHAGDIK